MHVVFAEDAIMQEYFTLDLIYSCLLYTSILHVHTKGRKLDTLEQLEIYKHTKTNKNDILNEQTQFKSHASVSYTHLDVYKRQVK